MRPAAGVGQATCEIGRGRGGNPRPFSLGGAGEGVGESVRQAGAAGFSVVVVEGDIDRLGDADDDDEALAAGDQRRRGANPWL